jgi:hypothetical protein
MRIASDSPTDHARISAQANGATSETYNAAHSSLTRDRQKRRGRQLVMVPFAAWSLVEPEQTLENHTDRAHFI